jgi:hypothetical protein
VIQEPITPAAMRWALRFIRNETQPSTVRCLTLTTGAPPKPAAAAGDGHLR